MTNSVQDPFMLQTASTEHRPLPSIVFVIYDCSGGARASYPGLWRIEHLLDLFTASANLDLSESDECRTTNNLDHHDSGPPHSGPVPSYGDHAIRILSPNPLPMPLRPLTLCFLTFHKNKPRCLRLDIQRTSSVMIMTECNWIKIQGLPCSNCEATSRQDNKCLILITAAYFIQQLIMLIMAFTMRFIINMNKLSSIVWIRTIIKLAASISVNLCYVIHLIFYLLFMIHAILHLICKKIFLKYFNADLSSECFWAVSSYLCFANAVISCSHYIMNRAEPRPLRWDVKHGITFIVLNRWFVTQYSQ